MSGTELAIILVLALLLLGPAKLPELARTVGKGIREFKRSTDDLRSTVESEFYRMDQPAPKPARPEGVVEAGKAPDAAPAALPPAGSTPNQPAPLTEAAPAQQPAPTAAAGDPSPPPSASTPAAEAEKQS